MKNTSTQNTVTFLEAWNSEISEKKNPCVWLVTVGIPTGTTLRHDTETDDFEEYFDISEWIMENEWVHELTGTLENGSWEWDGKDEPSYLTNSVTNLKLY